MSNNTCNPDFGLRRISIMGSTGSIGRQTLDIIERYPDLFEVAALTANSNWQLLASQALKFRPRVAVIADESFYPLLSETLKDSGVEVLAGHEALNTAATLPETDIVVGALVGFSGLESTVKALENGKTVALANKETLVAGGELIEKIIARVGKRILPVDSEHSAIFQCLQGEDPRTVSKIILTASGGPFRNHSLEQLKRVTVKEALAHPNWNMGAKVTIDSASMMNKGFEMIEAKWLFGKDPEDIDVLVHPESIIHSMVEFVDGSVKAQLGMPDMRLPIEVALAYPSRLNLAACIPENSLRLAQIGSLTFREPDVVRFPLLGLAYSVAREGGLLPAVMNAANEVAVNRFLNGKIKFTDISEIVIRSVDIAKKRVESAEVDLDSILSAHALGTEIASNLVLTE